MATNRRDTWATLLRVQGFVGDSARLSALCNILCLNDFVSLNSLALADEPATWLGSGGLAAAEIGFLARLCAEATKRYCTCRCPVVCRPVLLCTCGQALPAGCTHYHEQI